MWRIFPGCLREGIQACGFAALDTRTSKLSLLESGFLYTYWVYRMVKEYQGHPSLPAHILPPEVLWISCALAVGPCLELIGINHFFPSVWIGYNPDSFLPKVPL